MSQFQQFLCIQPFYVYKEPTPIFVQGNFYNFILNQVQGYALTNDNGHPHYMELEGEFYEHFELVEAS